MFEKDIIFTIILIIITLVSFSFTRSFLKKIGKIKEVSQKRIFYINVLANVLIFVIFALSLSMIWSVSISGMFVFVSSIFTVIGVALFAQWSILSNITASIIVFFSFPTRIGDTIKIIDGDNGVEGEIVEITLFQIKIIDKDKNIILYPNNLFIQKPIKKIKHIQKEDKIEDYTI